jgi:ABC-2 type transport system permease protein
MTTTTTPGGTSAVPAAAPTEARGGQVAAFRALVLRDLTVLRKEVGFFLARTIMQPFLLLFVFTYVFPKIGQGVGGASGSSQFNDVLIGGVIASAMIFQGIQAVALPMVQDFGFTREIEDRVLAPLPVWALAFEKVVAGAVQAMLAALVVFPLAAVVPASPVHFDLRPIYFFTIVPLGAIMSASLGLCVGTRVEPRQVSLVFSLLVIPMTFLGCVYYPWTSLGPVPWLKWLVTINPLVYLSEGLRMSLAQGVPHMAPVAIYGMMTLFAVLLLKFGVDGFRKRVLA